MPILTTLGAACARAWGFTSGLLKDPYFNLTTLLLPGNGTNGAQNNTFLDSGTANSGSGFTITRNGNTTQGTFSPFSQTGWGAYFGSSTANIVFASDASFGVGTGNFSVELSVNFTAWTGNQTLFYQGTSVTGYITLDKPSSGNTLRFSDPNGVVISYAWTPNIGQWYNIAVVRAGTGANQTTLYIDGVAVATGQSTGSVAASTIFVGGLNYISSYNIQGYISNLRYSNVARTITNPTSFFSSDANTLLLTCRSNRFVDISGTPKTISQINGTTSVTPFSPFAPTQSYSAAAVGGSGYFDGNGDYISTTGGAAIAVGAGAFTLEGWVYFNGFSDGAGFGSCAVSGDASTDRGVSLLINSASTWRFRIGRSVAGQFEDFLGSTTLTTGQWYHFQLVRTSTGTNDTRMYLNGVLQGSAGTSTININMQKFSVGTYSPSDASGGLINGYVSGVRLTNTAVASGVPTSPPTAVSGTAILLNFTNAGVVDATAKNVLETVGNAQISTTQSKWGGGSISFDGNGDRATMPGSALLALGGGDFTVEGWVYKSANTAYMTLCGNLAVAGENVWQILADVTGNKICWYNGASSSFTITSSATLNTGAWYYIAFVRSGSASNNFKLYINGSLDTQATMTTNYDNTSRPFFLGHTPELSAGRDWNGYVDDFRITKGYARTITASPTAPFPVQ